MMIGAAAFAVALSASAESSFSAPPGCGTQAEFESEVERLAGEGAQRAEVAEVLITTLGRGGFELRLRLGDELRVLRDPQCRTLFRSAAVIVAASSPAAASPEDAPLDNAPALPPAPADVTAPSSAPPPNSTPSTAPPPPVTATPRPSPAPPARAATAPSSPAPRATPRALRPRRVIPPRPTAPPSEPPPAAVVDTPPAEETSRSTSFGVRHFAVGLGAGASGGVLPGLGAMLSADLQLDPEPWGAALSIRYWPERSDTRSGRGLDVSAVGARVAALFRVAPGLHVLGGLELGRLGGSGTQGVLGGDDAAAWQFGPTLGANLIALDFQYLRIELGGAARFSLLRPRFVVTGFGDLYRTPPLGGDVILRGVLLF